MYFLGIDIVEAMNDALRVFLGFLCKVIYPMITNAWNLFVALSDAQLFNSSGPGLINEIYSRVGLLLGLIMLFKVIFSLIQMLLNPDLFSDKEKGVGNIAKRAIVVILLLGFTPSIFQGAFYIQGKVLDDNILARIILGTNEQVKMETFGSTLSANLLASFYTLNSYDPEGAEQECQEYKLTIAELRDYNKLDLLDTCLTEKMDTTKELVDDNLEVTTKKITHYVIDFNLNGVFAVVVGGAVLWIVVMYCIYLGARVVQLAFLQIVAPLAIVSYLSPKKDSGLEKWIKLCLSTFLDVFIRIAIIYFISLIIYLLYAGNNGEGLELLEETSGASGPLLTMVKVAVLLGLLMVAKKIPDLIGEIFPTLGVGKSALGFGISWKKMTEGMFGGKLLYGATAGTAKFAGKIATAGVAGAAFGVGLGFAGGRGLGRLTGALGGAARGMKIGSSKGGFLKNMGQVAQKQGQRNAQKIQWTNSGSTAFGRFAQKASNVLGYEGTAEKIENDITNRKNNIGSRKTKQQSYQKVSEYKKSMEDRAESKLKTGSFASGSNEWKLQQKVLLAEAKVKALENGGRAEIEKQLLTNEHNAKVNDLRNRGASQSEINQAELEYNTKMSEIEKNHNNELANAKAEYNKTLDEAKKEYIEETLNGNVSDGRITALQEDLLNTIDSNKESFSSLGGVSRDSSFAEIDAFEKEATKKANELQRENEMDEVAIANIENSEEYKKAKANRDAVGGQRGGN